MNATQETYDGWVCSDCIQWIANGEWPDHMSNADWLASLSDDEVTVGSAFTDDCECAGDIEAHAEECEHRSFTWSACDHCGSGLGGDRHAVTYWIAS